MKGGGKIYPNAGVKIDPRSITSTKMPESLKVVSGYLYLCYAHLKDFGILTRQDIESEEEKIKALLPYSQTNNGLKSSHWFRSDTYLIEFFRTSSSNYKVYALRLVFFEELPTLLRQGKN